MLTMTRLRDARARGDAGAVAVIVAIMTLTLFGVAALAVDIGETYNRRRATQTDADLAALAGAAVINQSQNAAFDAAYDYLVKNLPEGGAGVNSKALYRDGNLTNGEILFPSTYKIRVVVQPRLVRFGFANAIGFSSTNVRAAATAEGRSPAAALPYYMTIGSDSGYSCLKDTSGGQAKSAMRAALLPDAGNPKINDAQPAPFWPEGGQTMTITGTSFTGATSVTVGGVSRPFTVVDDKTITLTTLAHAAGQVSVVVTVGSKSDTFTTTYAVQAPTISTALPSPVSTVGGQTLTVTGTNYDSPAPTVTSVKVDGVEVTTWTVNSKTQITLTTPAHLAGSATLTVTNAHGFATKALTYQAPANPAPTVTGLSPSSGPQSGGTVVTITGTNLTGATGVTFGTTAATNVTVTNATTIQATAPAGTGAVHVHVTTPSGTSTESSADLYTYTVDDCTGSTGSYGYLNVGRTKEPTANGANDLVMINSIVGIDHSWTSFPAAKLPAPGTECQSGNTLIDGAILDSGNGVDGANCVDIENGNKTADVGTAFLDGYTKSNPDLDPRLKAPSGHDHSHSIHGRPTNLDTDHITAYLASGVTLQQFTNALASHTVTAGWIKPEIVQCPRFAIVPIVNAATNPANGYYPIKGFAGVFVDGPDPDNGFTANNNGNQMQSISAYAFSLDFLPGIISAGTTEGTVTYLGAGPVVPVLVHDAGDPSY